jgi:signal transduction histidine kinase/CheY-like chemotaxis protein
LTPFGRLSIRNKLIGIILAINLVSLGVGFLLVIASDVRNLRRDLVESTALVAQVIGDYSVTDLAFLDREESAKSLAKLASFRDVEMVCLYDTDGKLFSSYVRSGAALVPPPIRKEGQEFAGGHLHLSRSIRLEKEAYGTIYLAVSTRALDEKIRNHLLAFLAFSAALLAFAVYLSIRIQTLISRPIQNLAATARRISETHDYSIRVEKTSEDEIGVLCDSTNDMLAEIQRRERERNEAEKRTREKSQFLANMSHELRTPLNSIIGFSEVLLTRLAPRLDPRELKFLGNIHGSGEHLLGIVNDILDLSKIEAGQMEIAPEPVPLRATTEGVCVVMRGVSSRRAITFDIAIPDDFPLFQADPVKLKQILYNLLSNAVKYSPERGVIRIEAETVEAARSPIGVDSIRFSVIDRGIGIDPKDHETIFREYGQAEGAASGQFEGTGLGLALVRRFLELHGGRIDVASRLGEGSRFTVTLPIGSPPPDRGTPAPPPDEGCQASTLRLLVVEDDGTAYERISGPLVKAGFQVVRAQNGEEALRLARAIRPSAIALDLLLPGIDGWDVLRVLKSDPATRSIPVVILSRTENRELGLAFGAEDYFVKPVDPDRLIETLRRVRAAGSSSPTRLLVIDDDRQFHDLLEASLGTKDFVLDHALSGPLGLEAARRRPPDLIVLDLRMDGMDGFTVAMRLREEPATAEIPVVVATAMDLSPADRKRLEGRISAILSKANLHEGKPLEALVRELVARQVAAPASPHS